MPGNKTKYRSIFLIRHGQSIANQEKIIVSHPDHGVNGYGLTSKGSNQARRAGKELLKTAQDPIIISSNFARAKQTADDIRKALNCDHILAEELRERYFGELELKDHSYYHKVWEKDRNDFTHTTWNVESQQNILNRIELFWQKYNQLAEKHDLILVSHGDTLRVMECFFNRISLEHCHDLPYLDNCGILEVKPRSPVTIAAHRGNSFQFPENTIPAFHSACVHSIPYIELDFHYSKDHQCVVAHDPNFKRSAGTTKRIKSLTYKSICTINVAKKTYYPEPLVAPLLEEVLDLAEKHNTKVLVEMKAGWNPESNIAELVKKYLHRVELMDFDYRNLVKAKDEIPEVPCFWLIHKKKWLNQAIEIACRENFTGINVDKKLLLQQPEIIKIAHESGLKVYSWTIDETQDAIELILKGIDLITTNRPLDLIKILQ